jgi:hypothetical protein
MKSRRRIRCPSAGSIAYRGRGCTDPASQQLLSSRESRAGLAARLSPDHLPTNFGDRHPDHGNPPRAGAHRARLYDRQFVAHEAVKHRVREAVSQHICHGASMRGVGEQVERSTVVVARYDRHTLARMLGPPTTCTSCGIIGANARPKWRASHRPTSRERWGTARTVPVHRPSLGVAPQLRSFFRPRGGHPFDKRFHDTWRPDRGNTVNWALERAPVRRRFFAVHAHMDRSWQSVCAKLIT